MSTRPIYSSGPGLDFELVTPNDSADLTQKQGVWPVLHIETGGVVKLTSASGTTETLTLSAGTFPCRVRRVWATSLTASNITAIY